jgi:ribosomal protein S18 acetylase RimI-like enzyme
MASGLECRRLSVGLAGALSEFFSSLVCAGDNENFHPHPLTSAEAERVCRYEGKDLYYALVDGEHIVGYGMLRGWDDGYAIPSLGIALHRTVRRTGLGRTFMHFLHAAAKRRGASKVRLKVQAKNQAAIALYASLGYVFVHEDPGQMIGYVDL